MLNCNPQWVSPLCQPTTDIRALLSIAPVFQKVRVPRSIRGFPLGVSEDTGLTKGTFILSDSQASLPNWLTGLLRKAT